MARTDANVANRTVRANHNPFCMTSKTTETMIKWMRRMNAVENSPFTVLDVVEMVLKDEWGSFGSGDGEFNNPLSIDVYDDEVFVTDITNDRIQVFDLDGTYKRQWGSTGSGNGEFNSPDFLSVYNAEVFVIDRFNDRIQVFDLDGTYKRQWDQETDVSLRGIYVYNGAVFTTSNINIPVEEDYVIVYDLIGTYKRQWGSTGSGNGEFDVPTGISVYNNEVFVMDSGNDRIQVFDLDGTYKRQWGSTGSGNGEFNSPLSIHVYNGEVFAADNDNDRIQVFDLYGTYKRKLISSGDATISTPLGVHVYSTDIFTCMINLNQAKVFTTYEANNADINMSQWNWYLSDDSSKSMPDSDGGRTVPALNALSGGLPSSELEPNQRIVQESAEYINDLRKAIKNIVVTGAIINWKTDNTATWDDDDTENLYYAAMTPKLPSYGITDGVPRYNWVRSALGGKKVRDIDVGEVEVCIAYIEKCLHYQGIDVGSYVA